MYGWKFSGYLILICSFSLCQQNISKVNCFRVYRKLITRSSHAKSLLLVTLGEQTRSTNRLNVLNKSRRISAMFSALIEKEMSKSILPDVELLWAVLNPTVSKSGQNCRQKQTSCIREQNNNFTWAQTSNSRKIQAKARVVTPHDLTKAMT